MIWQFEEHENNFHRKRDFKTKFSIGDFYINWAKTKRIFETFVMWETVYFFNVQ